MKRFKLHIILTLALCLMGWGQQGKAQQNTFHSVLGEHTWYRLSVAHEGVYKLDCDLFQQMGIDVNTLNPNQIRVFGNPSGALPEKNSAHRPDDLTEMAIHVEGADDGKFDAGDFVLFYGQEPTRWNLTYGLSGYKYERDRNYYSDTSYYYLCVDSGVNGLRISEKESQSVSGFATAITEFPDFWWHEEELFSPYSIGQNWFGESVAATEGSLVLPFSFPNLVKDKSLRVKMSVMGRVKEGSMWYDMSIADNHLVADGRISYYGQYAYGTVNGIEKQFFLDSETAQVELSVNPEPAGALLFLDYIEIYAWRRLERVGDCFLFRLFPDQFGDSSSQICVQNAADRFWLWDVSMPLEPRLQNGTLNGSTFSFAVDEAIERRYAMFDPQAALQVESWTVVANQNLHAMDGEADMLIISSPLFMQQAQQLADFHEERDGLTSLVVDVKEIYNEFSTGICDPAGIRDFIRMVYQRSQGRLKYVTLFGRASFDFRDLKGYNRNFVPCFEQKFDTHHEKCFATDDFFGMMDDNEGYNSEGRVDIGIGRIPVSSTAEAEAMLRKIELYYDRIATRGEWKTKALFFSDDENSEYLVHNENYCQIMDTVAPGLNALKVYCGAYPVESTASGNVIPQANADLMRILNEGVFMLCYTGHGGVRGLTGDNVFTVSDINAMGNHEKMPFVFTATCEFSKYDDPLLVSAGEQLYLKPDGGAIAMLTTTRPTYGMNNGKLGRALMNELMRRNADGQQQRLGDVVKAAKCQGINYSDASALSLNICFFLMGDPALRLAYPENDIVALKINGKEVSEGGILLSALSLATVEGEIRTPDGSLNTDFNGELSVQFYDKKTPIRVKVKLANSSYEYRYYSHHKDVLFDGRVTVEGGKFAFQFQVPKDISLNMGKPRFEFYACDTVRGMEAIGRFDNLILNGVDSTVEVDSEGPQISFYWNTPDFVSGDVVESHGVLCADLFDEQGIYHYDFSLGRNIVMNSNLPAYDNYILNDRFEPALDDYRRGRITLPVSNLEPGTYEFSLKAWDTHDNSSEARLWIVVEDGLFLSQVWNYPNPVTDETSFTLSHNGDDGEFKVEVEVFDILGRTVSRLSQTVVSAGKSISPIRWNACDMSGHPLSSGLYFYRLTLTDSSGHSRTVGQKMVVTR